MRSPWGVAYGYTGAVVPPQDDDSANPPLCPPQEPGDWFSQLSSFGAGMGDAVSGG